MCSAVVVTLCLLVVVGNAAAGTVREKRCGNSSPAQDTSNSPPPPTYTTNSPPPPTDPPIPITRVTLPDFTEDMSKVLHTSQKFSQNYSGPLILDWTIHRYDDISFIILSMENITLADSTDCQDEYLEVRSVKANESLLVLRTCGVRVFKDTYFDDVDVHFKLYLQDAQTDHGVSFVFHIDTADDNLELHTEPSGEVLSPNYPTLPSPIPRRYYRVAVTPFHSVKLTLNDYDISNTGCEEANLMVYMLSIYNGDHKYTFICLTGQGPFISDTNLMEIGLGGTLPGVIHTGSGFNFTYEELPREI